MISKQKALARLIIFVFLASLFTSQASSAPTCGSFETDSNSNSYGSAYVSTTLERTEAYGKSCTDYPAANYAQSTVSCTGSGDTVELYLQKIEDSDGWDSVDFNCGQNGCNNYDEKWTSTGERDIKVRTSSGAVKDLYWICYAYEDNGYWAWTYSGYNDYNSQDVDQQANDPTSPSPSDGETDVSTDPSLELDVSDPDGDDIDVTFRDGDGNYIDTDYNVPSGSTASVTWPEADSKGTEYEWYAEVEDDGSDLSKDSSAYSFTTVPNNAPDSPGNREPNDNQDEVSTDADLEVYVEDDDNDLMDVRFYSGSDNLIGTDFDVCSGCRADTTWNNLDIESTYDWYAVADDGSDSTTSNTWSFDTVGEPDSASNPSPNNGQTAVSTETDLEVDVSHPDGQMMDVEFYTGGGEYIGTDYDVCDGCRASISTIGEDIASSPGTNYEWYVVADDGTRSTQSNTWNFDTISVPNAPDNPSPTGDSILTDENLEVDVSHPDNLDMDVTFSINDGTGWETIGTDYSVSDGATASINPELNVGGDYQWRAEASAQGFSTQSDTWSFSTIKMPDRPSLQNPTPNGAQTVSRTTSLEARFTHPDGRDMDVTFYLDDGSGYSQIGSQNSVSDGSTVSIDQSLATGTDYKWYVEAESQGLTTESNRWSFTTNYRPSIENVNVEDRAEGHSLSFSSTVIDFDGRDQLDSCEIDVSDGEGDSRSYSGTLNPGGSSIEAICNVDTVNFEDEDWTHQDELDFQVEITDDKGLSDSGTGSGQLPNHDPDIEEFYVRNYPDREGFRVEALIRPRDVGSDELRGCSIVVDDGANSVTGGNMDRVNSTHVRCIQEDVGFGRFSDLDLDSEIEVEVSATDIHGGSSSDSLMYNSGTGVTYDYSSVVMTEGGVEYIDYRLSNEEVYSQEYEIRLENVDASFGETGDNVTSLELRGGSSETLSIKITPDIGFIGEKDLVILSENLETGIETEDSVKVRIRDVNSSTTRSVPGIGIIHLIVLVILVYSFFYRRSV